MRRYGASARAGPISFPGGRASPPAPALSCRVGPLYKVAKFNPITDGTAHDQRPANCL